MSNFEVGFIDDCRTNELVDISFNEIAESKDFGWLAGLYASLCDASHEIKLSFDAFKQMECVDPEWSNRAAAKLKMLKIAMYRVEKRFIETNQEPPWPVYTTYRKSLNKTTSLLNDALKKLEKYKLAEEQDGAPAALNADN